MDKIEIQDIINGIKSLDLEDGINDFIRKSLCRIYGIEIVNKDSQKSNNMQL